jgi:Ca2+-binding RTX toxin-like protein
VRAEDVIGGGAADRITGDANANTLTGGAGDDTLDGGLGADVLLGLNGDDVLLALDGVADTTLDCDGGDAPGTADSASIDPGGLDPVPVGCEIVTF